MSELPIHRLLFITGTDTGVGKTLLTALLVSHLRRRELPALAIKPFCSGSRADAALLYALQGGDLTLDEINPFFFREPLAPLIAARRQRRSVDLADVLTHISSIARRLPEARIKDQKSNIRAPILLIEGAGGLLAPLGPQYFVLDLIRELRCEVVIVSRNKIGTLNHTLLTLQTLQKGCPHLVHKGSAKDIESDFCGPASRLRAHDPAALRRRFGSHRPAPARVVLMDQQRQDPSALSNPEILTEFLASVPLWKLPFFGKNCCSPRAIEKIERNFQKTLARILI